MRFTHPANKLFDRPARNWFASSAGQLFDRDRLTVQFGNYSPGQLNSGLTVRLARDWVR